MDPSLFLGRTFWTYYVPPPPPPDSVAAGNVNVNGVSSCSSQERFSIRWFQDTEILTLSFSNIVLRNLRLGNTRKLKFSNRLVAIFWLYHGS